MFKKLFSFKMISALISAFICSYAPAFAGEADLIVPDIRSLSLDNYKSEFPFSDWFSDLLNF